jgi:hypothetical protein
MLTSVPAIAQCRAANTQASPGEKGGGGGPSASASASLTSASASRAPAPGPAFRPALAWPPPTARKCPHPARLQVDASKPHPTSPKPHPASSVTQPKPRPFDPIPTHPSHHHPPSPACAGRGHPVRARAVRGRRPGRGADQRGHAAAGARPQVGMDRCGRSGWTWCGGRQKRDGWCLAAGGEGGRGLACFCGLAVVLAGRFAQLRALSLPPCLLACLTLPACLPALPAPPDAARWTTRPWTRCRAASPCARA